MRTPAYFSSAERCGSRSVAQAPFQVAQDRGAGQMVPMQFPEREPEGRVLLQEGRDGFEGVADSANP